MNQEELNKLFKQTQVGRIVDCTVDPVTNLYSLDDIRKLFEDNPDYSCIPVEMPSGNGLIFRDDVMHSQRSLFGDGKLAKYVDEHPHSYKANENVIQVLNDILKTEDPQTHQDFIVYYRKNYFGVGKFIKLVRYVNMLNAIDEKSAKELQQFLIDKSKFHHLPFKVSSYNRMASSLGGDFYKIFNINEDLMLVSIFDVAGKGITGALSTISVSSFFSLLSREKDKFTEPDTIVSQLNNYIYDQTTFSIFITAILMFVDWKSQKIIIYNMGHTKILSYEINDDGNKLVEIDSEFPPLGIDEELSNLRDSRTELDISSNRKIVFYSDGLSEEANDYGVMYGEKRIQEFFDNNIQKKNEEIISELAKDVEGFLGEAPLSDDITVLISDFENIQTEENQPQQQQKEDPLKQIQYLFTHSFDYSLHLYLNNSKEKEQKMYKCILLFSARKQHFLIVSRNTGGAYSGYLITESAIWSFDENREFTQISLDSRLFDTLFSPFHVKNDWLQQNFSVQSQKTLKTLETLSTTHLLCAPEQNFEGISKVDILIDAKHSVLFKMVVFREDIEERLTSKKWVQYKGEFFPKEFSISHSKHPDFRTKVYLSYYQQKQLDENIFSIDYLKDADLDALYD